jgi:hypothetical protein
VDVEQPIQQSAAAIVGISRKIGPWRTSNLLSFLAEWATAMKANGWQPITLEQFQAHWRVSRASAFRRQQLYRSVFPDQTPNERILHARSIWLAEQHKQPKPQDIAALIVAMPAA